MNSFVRNAPLIDRYAPLLKEYAPLLQENPAFFQSTNQIGVQGWSVNNHGVKGNSEENYGVYGYSHKSIAIVGDSHSSVGVHGEGPIGIRGKGRYLAGQFLGHVEINGALEVHGAMFTMSGYEVDDLGDRVKRLEQHIEYLMRRLAAAGLPL